MLETTSTLLGQLMSAMRPTLSIPHQAASFLRLIPIGTSAFVEKSLTIHDP
jgi:hypothetical protein